ncbi:putative ribonuclease H-like domain-containing protein [Tanacetum coccineum]|uniref:Ribonuclease H-like domain-containing protein n=1 Tax=Tanacetum coccineum TaxID=301880 RepID=A0ABQ4WNW3_9ASTR
MTTLADKAILSGADNRPPMLEKDMYDSWKSIMELYMMNIQHRRMILESVENGPLIWPSIKENEVKRPKKYYELSATEAVQADCDIKETNIILQGLPPKFYALEKECKLYDEFDKFANKKGETLWEFYLRFSLLLNDINIYNIKLEQFQVNTKFLNTLPPEWSKFVTDVKLVRDLHTTNVDQLHAYLGKHEFHANEGKDTCPNSALNQSRNGMILGLRIKYCWYKLLGLGSPIIVQVCKKWHACKSLANKVVNFLHMHEQIKPVIHLQPTKLNMSETQDENPPPPPPPSTQQTPTQQTPHTVSTIKLPILKKGEYDIWAMKMEHYLAHTDYPIWEVIQNGNGPVSVTTDTSGQIKILPPKTAEEIVARERERKARTTLLMAIPEDHLAKFHKMTDAKEMWNAIKSRFGGNDESKKMQKYILKQQFEGFTVSNTDGIHKGYERFQSLLSQLEIHGAGVSTEDANQKFLRSLPSAWLQVSLIMRNKPGMDSLSFDDLYNNLRVFENDVKGSTASSSNLQNIAFVSENTNSTNDVSTAYGVSNTSGHNSKHEQTSSYSLLASQSSCPQLDHEDLDQVDEYDLEEMDLKWQVAMISMRIKKFYKKTGRKLQFDAKEPVGFDKTKVECYNCHKTGHFARECRTKEDNRRRDGWNPGNKDGSRTGKKEESKALVTVDGESVDWTTHSEDDENYAFMASNSSGSDTQVTSCSNECKESYANLKRLYDAQREQLSDASVEIKAYTQGLKKVEAQLVAHQQGQLWYEQKIKFMKIDLDDKTDVLTYHKKLLAKAQKEKDDLEVIVDKWNHSSKNLGKIVNYHMSASDKFGLGYGDYRYSGILSYENEVLQSVFKGNKSDFENLPLHKRLGKTCEMQAVPPPMTGNYLPSGPDIEIDDSQYTYGPEKTQPSESESQTTELDTCDSNISTEPSELVSEPVVNESNIEVQPKVWSDAPIIEEYESDSDDEYVSVQTKGLDTPSFANKQVNTPRENVKNQSTHSQKPKVNNKELGNGFTERACFVCGSFSHLIRDCDYHVKLAKQVELNKQNMSKGNGTRERKQTWNNVQSTNKQNQFLTLAVQTRTGNNPVNTAKASSTNSFSTVRQNVNKQTVLTSTALKVNTVKPIVNGVRPANVFHKFHSPSSRPFKRTTVLKTNFSNQKVYTVKVREVSTVGEKWVTAVKSSASCKIQTGKLDFEDVSFVKELQHFNLFSVSQMCDKMNKVLFTDTECLILSPDFKLPDENQILLKVPRQNNMYSFNLENIVPLGGLACLIAKATFDESNLWHRRLGHVNFKNLNRLVKGNLVRGLPTKLFQNDHTCVACQKGKQHKASCKAKLVSSISHTLQLLHMDLFGPTSIRSINHKTYCLVITDDFSRFSWTFFLRSKDETSAILKDFIRQIENQLNQKVKTIRCDNGTEFKNRDINEFCGLKGIKREYSNARTPQQNGVAERKNRTLIEAARTMLADSFLPNTFWAEAVSTACYVLNREVDINKKTENQAKMTKTEHGMEKTVQNQGQSPKMSKSESILKNQHLISSLTDDLSLLSNMAALESCPKHNMIAYLEKTEGNVEFHEVIDFFFVLSLFIMPLDYYAEEVSHSAKIPRKSFIKKHREAQRCKMPKEKIDAHGNRKMLKVKERTEKCVDERQGVDEDRFSTEDVV